jgi:hypothetical protein
MTGAIPSKVCLRSGLSLRAGDGDDEVAGRGGNVDVVAAVAAGRGGTLGAGCGGALTASCGTLGAAGISSSPHSESISSVGGAIEGRGGLALTRSLKDRLSFIASRPAFHGRRNDARLGALKRRIPTLSASSSG